MKALVLESPNGPKGLVIREVSPPQILEGDCLVKVNAAAITRDELDWSIDRLPAIPSYEFAGVVVDAADDVRQFKPGDKVYGLSSFKRNGAAAEFIAVNSNFIALKPKSIDYVNAAAVPLACLSAWQGLLDYGELVPNQKVVIHGGSGGVGSFAVQLAAENGAQVIATTSSSDTEIIKELGANEVVTVGVGNYDLNISDADLVFDTVGGDRLAASYEFIKDGGRLISIASEPPKASGEPRKIEAKYFVVDQKPQQLHEISKLIDTGKLAPVIDRVFKLEDGQKAYEYLQRRHGAGKIVLEITN